MKRTFALVIAFISLTSFVAKEHESYLSVTEIEYDKAEQSLQIVSRVFTDDFENVLSKRYQQVIHLSYEEDLEANKEIISRYIDQKLKIKVDGRDQELKFLGSKFDGDQVVLFIEGNKVRNFQKIQVENLILTDLFDAQKNIVHVKKGESIESMLLMKGNGSKTVNF